MLAKKIGGLPLTRGNHQIRIITVTDLLHMISDIFSEGDQGLIIQIRAREDRGVLAVITGEIARLGGNITHLLSCPDTNPKFLRVTMKLQDVTVEDIIPLLTDVIGVDILSIQAWKNQVCLNN